jgi:hypothetical protein
MLLFSAAVTHRGGAILAETAHRRSVHIGTLRRPGDVRIVER